MSNDTDNFLYAMNIRKSVNKWRVLCLVLLVTLLVIVVDKSVGVKPPTDYIAKVEIEGIILEDLKRDEKLINIRNDSHAKALIVYINSPGGTLVGGETLYNTLKKIADKKPVVAVIGSLGASGGYMAALPAHRIFAQKGSLTGSIGVIVQTAEVTELSKKLGINFITFKSGELKGTPSPFEKLTPKAELSLQKSIDDSFDIFVEMVASGRKMKKEQVLPLADGRIFNGREALKNKLIDDIGDIEDATNWLKNKKKLNANLKIKDIDLRPEKSKLELLLSKTISGDNLLSSFFGNMNGFMALMK